MSKKNILTIVALLGFVTFTLSSCHHHTCPTYSKAETKVSSARHI